MMMSLPSFSRTSLSRIRTKNIKVHEDFTTTACAHRTIRSINCVLHHAILLLLHHVDNNDNLALALCCYTLYYVDNNDNPAETYSKGV